ncbi:oxaloacetate decarboxylase gamma chain [bioreactor metagenome]|uniref:Oxaloacetate decarboxylase gamma chain n=1 Tax=bioreactor metagenome TaxID=1076179 RepID=A0A644Z541_9ZZZZ
MNNWELLMAGIKLLIFGMGMVYIFLVIMIWVMDLLKRFLRPYDERLEAAAAASAAAAAKARRAKAPAIASGGEPTLAAAAAVAVHLALNGGPVRQVTVTEQVASGSPAAAPVRVQDVGSPLPGTVNRVLLTVGSAVAAGEPVLVLEAMKMETEIKAEHAGTITAIPVAAGQVVAVGDPLFSMEVK